MKELSGLLGAADILSRLLTGLEPMIPAVVEGGSRPANLFRFWSVFADGFGLIMVSN